MSANLAAVWIVGIIVGGVTISNIASSIGGRKRDKDGTP